MSLGHLVFTHLHEVCVTPCMYREIPCLLVHRKLLCCGLSNINNLLTRALPIYMYKIYPTSMCANECCLILKLYIS